MSVGLENKGSNEKSSEEQQLVIFKVANEEFGVDINDVKEIIRWEEVTRIPNSPPYIKGVINLRGSIIVVNDLSMKLGLPSKDIDDDTRILVVEVKDNTVGMVVDSATEVIRLSGEKIQPAPNMIKENINTDYIEGVGLLDEKRLLTLLDLEKVIHAKDFENMNNIKKQAESKKNNLEEKSETSKKEKKTDKKKDKKETKKSDSSKKEKSTKIQKENKKN